jgi:hypothetical protein
MNRYILDTDHLILLKRNHPIVRAKISSIPPADIFVTIVTIEEQYYKDFIQVPGLSITYGTLRERGLVNLRKDINIHSRPRFGLQSTNPIASLSKSPAKAISITASTGKSISMIRSISRLFPLSYTDSKTLD